MRLLASLAFAGLRRRDPAGQRRAPRQRRRTGDRSRSRAWPRARSAWRGAAGGCCRPPRSGRSATSSSRWSTTTAPATRASPARRPGRSVSANRRAECPRARRACGHVRVGNLGTGSGYWESWRGRQHHHHRQPHRRVDRDPDRGRRGRRQGLEEAARQHLVPRPGLQPRRRAPAVAITELDGDAGILRYRGYPIEQLAEKSSYLEVAYLLIYGELPQRRAVRDLALRDHAPHVHPRERAQALHGGLPLRRPPHGHARVRRRRPVDLLPRGQGHRRPEVRDKQIVRLIAKMPTLAACAYRHSVGHAVRLPRQQPRLRRQLPVDDVEDRRAALRAPTRCWPGRSTCCSSSTPTTSRTAGTTAMRTIGSSHADPYIATAPAAAAALYGPRHGGANEAVIKMLNEIGSVDNVAGLREAASSRARSGSRASATGSTRTTTPGPRSSSRSPTRSSRSPARTRCSTSR